MRVAQVVYGLCVGLLGCLSLFLATWCGYALTLVSDGFQIRLFLLLLGIGALAGASLIFVAWRAIFPDSAKQIEVKPSADVTQERKTPLLILVVWPKKLGPVTGQSHSFLYQNDNIFRTAVPMALLDVNPVDPVNPVKNHLPL